MTNCRVPWSPSVQSWACPLERCSPSGLWHFWVLSWPLVLSVARLHRLPLYLFLMFLCCLYIFTFVHMPFFRNHFGSSFERCRLSSKNCLVAFFPWIRLESRGLRGAIVGQGASSLNRLDFLLGRRTCTICTGCRLAHACC